MSDRVLKVTLTMRVDPANNLHRGTTRERLQTAAAAFVQTAREEGVQVKVDDATMDVSFDCHRFDYQEQIKSARPRRTS